MMQQEVKTINASPVNPGNRRLDSLDAFRGFTMLLMASRGFGFAEVAQQFPESHPWQWLGYHFSHVPWRGGGLWDMIQPFFMFMVGVSMPFSYAKRRQLGQSRGRMLGHAVYRAFFLIMLGVLLRSRWMFTDVLSQIGLGYVFLFLLRDKSTKVVGGVLCGVLLAYWALFALWPLPIDQLEAADLELASVGVSQQWHETHDFTGFASHWNKNTNPAHWFDVWFLNFFPRKKPFLFEGGGYQTLNCIPSLGTMILGLFVGRLLMREVSSGRKFQWLVLWGVVGIFVGLALDHLGVCPIVKRIWTPSWTLYSAGIATLVLTILYGLIDLLRYRAWAWIGIVVGLNSIAMYVMSYLTPGWITKTIAGLCGNSIFDTLNRDIEVLGAGGEPIAQTISYAPILLHTTVLAVLWFFCWRLYRQKIFFKI